ncbi:MAG TPA: pitrilysin family protein [Planctomycetota bacterium]|nr:pitrilysin family protein [Planctomycetota bacterium]
MIRIACILLVLAAAAEAQEAAHPRDLKFEKLDFQPPKPSDFRVRLENGLTAYLVPDDSVPSVRIRAYVRTGSLFDPEEKEGLCALTFASLRAGGAGELGADDLEAKLDSLGAAIEGDASEMRATLDAWTLSARAEEVLAIFADVLRRPRFEKASVERLRDDATLDAQNDDDPSLIATRRMRLQLYGKDHPYARYRTADTVGALKRSDLVSFHKKQVKPGRIVLAVSGKFDPKSMKKKIEDLFGDWNGGEGDFGEVPDVTKKARGGIVVIDRPDMSAAYLQLGHLGVAAGSQDEAALTLTDHIWGSGSFTSRFTAKVRTEEGLAYTCESAFDLPPLVPGLVKSYMQCQASEASYALKLTLEEARRLAESGPTAEELAAAKEAVLGRFPSRFTTATDRARALAEADLDGLPEDYFAKYRDRISAVTADDVKAAASRYYGEQGRSIIVVGPLESVRRSPARGTSLDELGKVTVGE